MVRMKKGKLTLSVPAGAVRKYISAGWEPTESLKSDEILDEGTFSPETKNDGEIGNVSESEVDYSGEFEDEVEYVDPEELAHRPLGELDKEELRILAEYKGIDTSNLNSAKQLRTAIRSLE